jgi:ribosomal protein L11 methylase PrmA
MPHFPRILKPDGRLILSGILTDQVREVEERLHKYRLYIEDVIFQEEWACLTLKK